MKKVPCLFKRCEIIEEGYYFFAAKPELLDDDEEFTRLFLFDSQDVNCKWRRIDIPGFEVADICTLKKGPESKRSYVAVSKNGHVFYTWPGGELTEKIDGAGLDGSGAVYGYVDSILEVSNKLHACGGGGQIYRRNESGWNDIAGSLRVETPLITQPLSVNLPVVGDVISAIDGYSLVDMYAAGLKGIYHFDGVQWRLCHSSTDGIINHVNCTSDGIVWACGYNGAILRGDFKVGFTDVGGYDTDVIFTKIVKLKNEIFLASSDGLFTFNIEEGAKKIKKIPRIKDCEDVSSDGKSVLCVSRKKIYLLANGLWNELKHPDNS